MLASSPTYCDPARISATLSVIDRIDAETCAWHRTPAYMRRPGYYAGIDAVVIMRRGVLEPVALSDLTALELDKLLTVPALTAGGRS